MDLQSNLLTLKGQKKALEDLKEFLTASMDQQTIYEWLDIQIGENRASISMVESDIEDIYFKNSGTIRSGKFEML